MCVFALKSPHEWPTDSDPRSRNSTMHDSLAVAGSAASAHHRLGEIPKPASAGGSQRKHGGRSPRMHNTNALAANTSDSWPVVASGGQDHEMRISQMWAFS